MKYIGVIGTRRRDTEEDLAKVRGAVFKIFERGDIIVSGGCEHGGDRFAEILAGELEHKPILFLPDKSKLDPVLLKKNPRVAYAIINYARNGLVTDKVNYLIACVALERTGGTEDTIKRFTKKCKALGWNLNERLILV